MNKVEELLAKANELLKKEEEKEMEKKHSKVVWVFAILGIIAAVGAAAYCIYRFFTPDYLEDFEDDFEDDFDDDFFEDDDEESAKDEEKKDEKKDEEKTEE